VTVVHKSKSGVVRFTSTLDEVYLNSSWRLSLLLLQDAIITDEKLRSVIIELSSMLAIVIVSSTFF